MSWWKQVKAWWAEQVAQARKTAYVCGYEYARQRLMADDCAAGKLWMAHHVPGWAYGQHRDFDKGVQDAVKDYIAKLEEKYQASQALDV